MGCYCTKTKERQESKTGTSQITKPRDEQRTQSSVYIQVDFEDLKPQKICYISNSYRGKPETSRIIGGKKEIFSQLYVRPFQKK